MKYEIGQEVWRATFEMTERHIECPHCGGSGRLRVTFDDDTTVSIECQNCSRGYNPPTGFVSIHDRQAGAMKGVIGGIEMRSDKEPEYKIIAGPSSYWCVSEAEIFDDEQSAMALARQKAAEADAEELKRVSQKEEDTRSWAWNATYHRNQIKHAKKDIAYHESKLAVASVKAKEPPK